MIEFKNTLGKQQAKSADQKELTIEAKLKIMLDDMEVRINSYKDEEIEKLCKHLKTFTIEGNKREGLLDFIRNTPNLSEAENLDKIISAAEIRMREVK